MTIRILTLSFNGLDKLKRLKVGLVKNLVKTKQEYVHYIRDNGSKDNTLKEINTWQNVKAFGAGHNRDSFSCGVNSLYWLARQDPNYSKQDVFMLLNNDIEFNDENSLVEMLKLLDDPEVGIVGARLLYPKTNILQHAGVIFGKRYNELPYHYRHKEKSKKENEQNKYFQAITGACMFIRAGLFDQVKGMDEGFNWSLEDVDLCLKVGALGKKIAYCGKTNISHEESATLKTIKQNVLFLNQNVKHFRNKWNGKYIIDHELYLNDPNYNLIL